MPELPISFLNSLKDAPGFEPDAFSAIHAAGEQITSVRFNPYKPLPGTWRDEGKFLFGDVPASLTNVPWSRQGYYVDPRPSFTFDPLFHAGAYYVQEASSMFLEQALLQLTDAATPLRVLDLSAAPGGKSTHALSLISEDSLLVSNDVIRSRANVLMDNIIRWGVPNVIVTNNDPRDFARVEGFFDVIIADAPCSGSGLFRKDPSAISEWSVNNVNLCSQRQQRILADVWPALKENGILIYSTCSYSTAENEDIHRWLINEMKATNLQVLVNSDWGITETSGGYRFWPDKVKGEGFFMACVRKTTGETHHDNGKPGKAQTAGRAETALATSFLDAADLRIIRYENDIYAWPSELANDMSYLLERLRVIYSGCKVGELMRDKIVPDHAVALSVRRSPDLAETDLSLEQAIAYLQRQDMKLETIGRGWQLVKYQGHSLGWINVLPNRINNYYPKELRILKIK